MVALCRLSPLWILLFWYMLSLILTYCFFRGLVIAPFLIRCSLPQLSPFIDFLPLLVRLELLGSWILQMSHTISLLASVHGSKVINMHVIQQAIYPSCALQWSGGTLCYLLRPVFSHKFCFSPRDG